MRIRRVCVTVTNLLASQRPVAVPTIGPRKPAGRDSSVRAATLFQRLWGHGPDAAGWNEDGFGICGSVAIAGRPALPAGNTPAVSDASVPLRSGSIGVVIRAVCDSEIAVARRNSSRSIDTVR